MQMPTWQVQTGLNPRNLKLVHLLGHLIKIDVLKKLCLQQSLFQGVFPDYFYAS